MEDKDNAGDIFSTSALESVKTHSNFLNEDQEVEEILHDLKIFASLKENERVSTAGPSVTVHKAWDKLVSLKRLYYGESRVRNFAYIEKRFQEAFAKIDKYLVEKERTLGMDPSKMTRTQLMTRLKNTQMINRLRASIQAAKEKIIRVFSVTYADDATAISRVERLTEDIEDKLKQVEVSVRFLEEREKQPS